MLNFLGRRIAYSAISLVGLIILVFFLARLTGDPSYLYLPVDATQAMREEFAARHGFDQPSYVQFGLFVRELLTFDFGSSLYYKKPALDVVLNAFPTTLWLAFFTMLFSLTISIVTGSLAAAKPDGMFDRIATALSLTGASAPNFWVAIVGILVFAVWLRLVPTSGIGGPQYWILPILVLVIGPCGRLVQVVRGSMISALSSGYVRTARAKGAGPSTIIFVHALRNSMLPVITVAGDLAAGILNGAVIVETVFGFPGIGKLMIDAITNRDFAVLQTAVMVSAIAIFIMNIAIDIIYVTLDPRVRTE